MVRRRAGTLTLRDPTASIPRSRSGRVQALRGGKLCREDFLRNLRFWRQQGAVEKRLIMVKLYSHRDIETATRRPAASKTCPLAKTQRAPRRGAGMVLPLAVLASLRETGSSRETKIRTNCAAGRIPSSAPGMAGLRRRVPEVFPHTLCCLRRNWTFPDWVLENTLAVTWKGNVHDATTTVFWSGEDADPAAPSAGA